MTGLEFFEGAATAQQLSQVLLILFVLLAWTLLWGLAGFFDESS